MYLMPVFVKTNYTFLCSNFVTNNIGVVIRYLAARHHTACIYTLHSTQYISIQCQQDVSVAGDNMGIVSM